MKTLRGIALVLALALVTPLLAVADDAAVPVKEDTKEKTAAKEESRTDTPKDSDKAKKEDKDKSDDEKVKPYPLKTCLVTDNDLKSMGDPVTIVHDGQEIKFCCAPCEKKFLKDPAKYLEKLSKATEEK